MDHDLLPFEEEEDEHGLRPAFLPSAQTISHVHTLIDDQYPGDTHSCKRNRGFSSAHIQKALKG